MCDTHIDNGDGHVGPCSERHVGGQCSGDDEGGQLGGNQTGIGLEFHETGVVWDDRERQSTANARASVDTQVTDIKFDAD